MLVVQIGIERKHIKIRAFVEHCDVAYPVDVLPHEERENAPQLSGIWIWTGKNAKKNYHEALELERSSVDSAFMYSL